MKKINHIVVSIVPALALSYTFASGHGSHTIKDQDSGLITIGQTQALIPEAGLSKTQISDGHSGNINFPYAQFKAIATVGEIDKKTGKALTGYPDGHAAWLKDNNTVRVAYQSESYATMGKAPNPETYPQVMSNGTTFTGSHIHTIDYDRAGFAEFLNNNKPASNMVVGSGHLFDKVYNAFGHEVRGKNHTPTDLSAKWGNQVRPDGTVLQFSNDYKLGEADWFFQSFCGAWYEPSHKFGKNVGFEDDVWLTAEEWEIGRMFPNGKEDAKSTLGLASIAVDIKNKTAYTVPALGQTGYEKLLPINPKHKDYVVIVLAGYNHGQEPAPNKIYIGMKNKTIGGQDINYLTANKRDAFLARNGLLYGKIYGLALSDNEYKRLNISVNLSEKMMDKYLQDKAAPNQFSGRFYPTSYQWKGWDQTPAVKDTEMMLWENEKEQPKGYAFFNGDTKTEHPAVDPNIANTRYVQNMTHKGGLFGFDFGNIRKSLNAANGDLPKYVPVNVTRIVAAVDGALTLNIGNEGKTKDGDASIHMEKNVAKMVSPDGLFWSKSSDGDYLIVDEDSGNDYGERKYVLPINHKTMLLQEDKKGYLLALAGGKHSARYASRSAALPGAFSKATTSEFSGSWNITPLIVKKNGKFLKKEDISGVKYQEVIERLPSNQQTYIGVVQARGESGGQVAELGGDAGGQVFQFKFDLK